MDREVSITRSSGKGTYAYSKEAWEEKKKERRKGNPDHINYYSLIGS